MLKFFVKWFLICCGILLIAVLIGLNQADQKLVVVNDPPSAVEAPQPLSQGQLSKLWADMRLNAELYCGAKEEAKRFAGQQVIDQPDPEVHADSYNEAWQLYSAARPYSHSSLPAAAPTLVMAVKKYC